MTRNRICSASHLERTCANSCEKKKKRIIKILKYTNSIFLCSMQRSIVISFDFENASGRKVKKKKLRQSFYTSGTISNIDCELPIGARRVIYPMDMRFHCLLLFNQLIHFLFLFCFPPCFK